MYILDDYDKTLQQILDHGQYIHNKRTGEETLSLHGVQCKYDVSDHFPILTRRKINFSANVAELLWFLEGSTSIDRLEELGCKYWEPWRDDEFTAKHNFIEGSIGKSYGHQLRRFGQCHPYFQDIKNNDSYDVFGEEGTDQLVNLLEGIKKDPSDRGLIINLWNADDLEYMRLRPCAYAFQVLITDGIMDGILVQRSADWPVGVPYNLTFYTTFLYLLAQQTGHSPGTLTHQVGDAHIYVNQQAGVQQYLKRPKVDNPIMKIKAHRTNINYYEVEDFYLEDYTYCAPDIKFEVAV